MGCRDKNAFLSKYFCRTLLGYSIIVNYEQDQKGMTSEGSYIRRMHFTNYFYSLNSDSCISYITMGINSQRRGSTDTVSTSELSQ